MTIGFPCGLLRGGTNFRVITDFIARKWDGSFIYCFATPCDKVYLALSFALTIHGHLPSFLPIDLKAAGINKTSELFSRDCEFAVR